MADITKYAPIGAGNSIISDFNTHLSLVRTKKTAIVAYAFVFGFIALTLFLAFTPSPNSSSPWAANIFLATSTSTSKPSSILSPPHHRSHFSSFFSYFFPSSSPPTLNATSHNSGIQPLHLKKDSPSLQNQTPTSLFTSPTAGDTTSQGPSHVKNHTQIPDQVEVLKHINQTKAGVLKQNQTHTQELHDRVEVPKTINTSPESASGAPIAIGNGIEEKGLINNLTSSLMKKKRNDARQDPILSLMNCDFFDGNWVKDDSYPLYKPGSCSLIDEQFNCFLNGRPDNDYHRMRWKPRGCTLPRLDGSRMLEMLRRKRLVFVGDSLNRNMWESLICILKNSVKDQSQVYEQQGRQYFRTDASFSIIFEDYKCTVEFFVAPFLVQEWQVADKNGTKKETLRLDIVDKSAHHYKNADIIVFNTGHWWTHEKTSKGEDYYQEGSHVYQVLDVLEAFRKALTTWGKWVDANVNPEKTLVFFRGYSASHFSGGQWNSGGACDHETEPIKKERYLTPYPAKMTVVEKVLKGMKTQVTYLNVTRMTDYRKDGHPSLYRKQKYTEEERRSPLRFQDCSHWCLPGVPDAWNEILYAQLLVNQKQRQKKQ